MENRNDNNDSTDNVQRIQVQHKRTIEQVVGLECCDTTVAKEPPTHETQIHDDEELRLDYELNKIRNMRLTFLSALHMLEAARDDLSHSIPNDTDELCRASQRIRAALAKLCEQIE